MQIDAALGTPWNTLGEAIEAAGPEDSSGLRRMLAAQLANKDYVRVTESLRCTTAEAERLRAYFVAAYGEPPPEGAQA